MSENIKQGNEQEIIDEGGFFAGSIKDEANNNIVMGEDGEPKILEETKDEISLLLEDIEKENSGEIASQLRLLRNNGWEIGKNPYTDDILLQKIYHEDIVIKTSMDSFAIIKLLAPLIPEA